MAGADGNGIAVTGNGLEAAMARAAEMGKRFANMSPALKVIGAEMVKRTDDAFEQSRSPAGEAFPPLAQSTLLARARKLKSARKRNKRGELTKGALKTRAKIMAPGGAKPMIDTARARGSQHTEVSPHLLKWSAVGYLAPHITGGQRRGKTGMPPKRNVTVFEHGGGGLNLSIFAGTNAGWRMNASMDDFARRTLVAYVQTGNAAVSA